MIANLILMGTFFKIILFIAVAFWVFRAFKQTIVLYLSRFIARQLQREMTKQQQAYDQSETDGFRKSVYQDKDVHVTAPKADNKKKPQVTDFAEDIDFEVLD